MKAQCTSSFELENAVITPIAKIAGAAATFNPTKLLDGLEDLVALTEAVEELHEDVTELYENINDFYDGIKEAQTLSGVKRYQWYPALRLTSILIRLEFFDRLLDFVNKDRLSCSDDKDFLCGLVAQLEISWQRGTQVRRKSVESFLST
jgi:hypothetical protein